MKIKYSIIFLGIILLSIFSCSNSNGKQVTDLEEKKQVTDLEKENLKGDVILVNSDEKGYKSVFYDENGLIKKVQEEISDEQQISSIRDYYYSNGKLDFIEIKSNGYTEKTICFYDLSGVLLSTKSTLSFSTGGSFDAAPCYYKFDIMGNMILDSCNTETWCRYYYTDNEIDSLIDNLSKKITIYSQGIPSKDLVFEISDNKKRNIKFIINYKYNYDAKGNWIQRKSNIDGKEVKVVNRTIIYKDGNIGQYEKKYSDYVSSLNNSSDNNSQTESNENSSSNTYQEPERQKQPEKVKCYSCRGSGDCGECGKIFRVHTWEGYQGWKDRNETRLGYVMCSDCSGAGVLYKRSDYPNVGKWEIEKKCYVGNCNSGWKPCNKCNGYGNGTLLGKCRDCKGSGYRN